MANPAGESKDEILKLDFNRRLMLQFRGSVVTSDAGLLAYRELDDALGLTAMAGETLADGRTGKNGRHALVGLLRQSVFGRLAGYEDVNDAQRLRHDPASDLRIRRFHANFSYSSGKPDQAAPGDRQGRVASGRALSARRLHRHQLVAPGRPGCRLLQQARHMRTMDQRGKRRDQWTRLSCPTFAANAVRLQLHALSYNLGNFLRTLGDAPNRSRTGR